MSDASMPAEIFEGLEECASCNWDLCDSCGGCKCPYCNDQTCDCEERLYSLFSKLETKKESFPLNVRL